MRAKPVLADFQWSPWRHTCLLTLTLVVLAGCSSGVRGAAAASAATAQPNIVFILNDDLGWGDVGYHGSEIQTPTIDRLAQRGVELNRYYTYAVCSPTRAALMTGRSSLETGVDAPIGLGETLPMQATLLPQHLRNLGYQTAMVGKWHLGRSRAEYLPFNRGFDYYYGFLSGFIDHYTHLTAEGRLDWQRNGVSVREEGHTTDLLTADAIRQIQTRDRTRPLFLYLAYDAPHTPLQAPEEYVRRNAHIADPTRRVFAAMMQHQDDQLARVLATIESEGMSANTLIIWASDNGPQGGGGASAGALRGQKGTTFEGGQRVPAVAYWPGVLDGGRKLDSVVTILDWFPTLIKVAGGKVPSDGLIVGHDAMPVLQGGKQAPGASFVLGNRSARIPDYYESAYRWPWKLVRIPTLLLTPSRGQVAQPAPTAPFAETIMLFDLATDPNESNDVAVRHPEIVAKLLADLDAAPRAPRSLSEWSPEGPRNGPARVAPARAGGNLEDRPPGGGNALLGFKEEKGEPLAEAAARATAGTDSPR